MTQPRPISERSTLAGMLQPEVCPECRSSLKGLAFCPRDGHVATLHPFAVGERYVVEKKLGAGGTSLVFSGRHKALGKSVALKVLRPELAGDSLEAQRFLRAARLSSQLAHENIVTVHDFGEDAERKLVFLVMEKLEGTSLAAAMRAMPRMPWQRVVPILVQICRALAEAHRHGVVHRDLGPRNVMLTHSSTRADLVKLCDFGLSRTQVGEDRITATGVPLGTPAYMAPEQVRGDEAQTHLVDIYALGVIAYEMLAGRLPHEANTAVAMIAQKLTTEPVPLSTAVGEQTIPTPLRHIVMQCLAANPLERPQSAEEVEQALTALLGSSKPSEPVLRDLTGTMVGNYRVLSLVGQGGMGEVYVAEHNVMGTHAALKVLLPEIAQNSDAVARFVSEAKASNEIRNPSIPRYYDFGTLADGRSYALMEWIEGRSVADLIAKKGALPVEMVRGILRQTAQALASAHKLGIVHRDIKPDHIVLCKDPDGGPHYTVKILDFGIAKITNQSANQTQVGLFMGTPAYCAPEQILGEPIGPTADIYALGATGFEMLTGVPPFSGDVGKILAHKIHKETVAISELKADVPMWAAQTIESMLAKDSAKRPQSMSLVITLLDAWPLGGVAPTQVAPQNQPSPAQVRPRPASAPLAMTPVNQVSRPSAASLSAQPPGKPPAKPSAVAITPIPSRNPMQEADDLRLASRVLKPWMIAAGACGLAAGLLLMIFVGRTSPNRAAQDAVPKADPAKVALPKATSTKTAPTTTSPTRTTDRSMDTVPPAGAQTAPNTHATPTAPTTRQPPTTEKVAPTKTPSAQAARTTAAPSTATQPTATSRGRQTQETQAKPSKKKAPKAAAPAKSAGDSSIIIADPFE